MNIEYDYDTHNDSKIKSKHAHCSSVIQHTQELNSCHAETWFVCGWQLKLYDPPCYTRAISERFRGRHYNALYKFTFFLFYFMPVVEDQQIPCPAIGTMHQHT